MLVPASLYKDEIEKQFKAIQYTDKYLWYTGSIDNYDLEVKTEGDKFAFAIVEPFFNQYCKTDYFLLGYVSFRVDWYCGMAYNFGLIRFEQSKKATKVMASAIREVIRMVESFNLHRIDFRCISGNPAETKYDGIVALLINQGKFDVETPIFRDNIKDTHGKYHDTICYELIRR
jgi:hypothetical protein